MGMIQEFMEFLKEYKVIPLAIAFIMGAAATALVTSLVNDMIMPVIGVLIPGGDWKNSTLTAGPVKFAVGSFVSQVINFVIIAFVIFLIVKLLLKEKKDEKK
jgi:large conductance mechanosensitive channel